MPGWIEFTRRATHITDQPMVTIQRQRNLSLNSPAYQALGRPSHVVLLFNPDEQLVGIRPAAKDVPHAYQIRKQQQSESYLLSAQAFLSAYSLTSENARRFEATMQDDMLVIDLKTGGTIVGRGAMEKKKPAPRGTKPTPTPAQGVLPGEPLVNYADRRPQGEMLRHGSADSGAGNDRPVSRLLGL